MTRIEKENGQIFEVYNKKEFIQLVKDLAPVDKIWTDDDSSLEIEYADGTECSWATGDSFKKVKLSKIKSGAYHNPSTIACFNKKIIYNEKYEDYEIL